MAAKISLSWTAPPVCDLVVPCIPLSDESFTTTAPDGEGWEWSAPAPDVVDVEPLRVPEGVEITVENGTLFVRRGVVGDTGCATARVTNACSNAVWSFEIPQACILPCPALAPKIKADSTGEATSTIRLPAVSTGVIGTTGLDDASVSVFGTTLTVLGEVETGPYTIVLTSPCGPCTIAGEIEVEVEPEEPPCFPIRLLSTVGTFSADVGATVDICYTLAGTHEVQMINYTGLPPGLAVKVTIEGEETKVCISGTVVEDLCAPAGGCRTGKITLRNCAGDFELSPQIYVTPPDQTLPFCAGFVILEEVLPSVPPNRCWKVTASRFAANTELFIRTNIDGDEFPITGPVDIISGDILIPLDDEGAGTGTVCVQVSGSGCARTSLVAYHPRCAVLSNIAQVTNTFQYLDCPPDTAGGA